MGGVGSALYTFMTYPMYNIAFMKHRVEDLMQSSTPEERKIALKVLGSNLAYVGAFGGMSALPFMFVLKAAYGMFMDPEDDLDALVRKYTPKTAGRALTMGIPSIFGNDLSWKVEGTDILGAPIGFQTLKTIYKKIYYQAYKPLKRGDEWHTLFMAAPDMIANPYKAFFAEGGTGKEGKPPIEYETNERIWKALGFTPTRESETRKTQDIARKTYEGRLEKLERFAERYNTAKKNMNSSAMSTLQTDVYEYNQKQRKQTGITISWADVKKSAKQRMTERVKGYQERLPKYMAPFQREVAGAFGTEPRTKRKPLMDYLSN